MIGAPCYVASCVLYKFELATCREQWSEDNRSVTIRRRDEWFGLCGGLGARRGFLSSTDYAQVLSGPLKDDASQATWQYCL